jgi:hypothetical protein
VAKNRPTYGLTSFLEERILRGVAEINGAPVAHRWSNFTALETQL